VFLSLYGVQILAALHNDFRLAWIVGSIIPLITSPEFRIPEGAAYTKFVGFYPSISRKKKEEIRQLK
jgi:hypothetical protein